MKRFLFLAFFLLSPGLAQAEVITYDIKQMGLTVGQASLAFGQKAKFEGQDYHLVIFTAQGMNFRDEEKIYLSPQTYRPVVILRDLNIFGKKEKITERYLSREGKIKITKEVKGRIIEQTLQKSGDLENIYGFIARYRRQGSFKMGDIWGISLPTKDLSIHLVKQVNIAVAGKKYKAFYMESQPPQYKIWFSAGPEKLPLRISGSIGLANTTMIMKSYQE